MKDLHCGAQVKLVLTSTVSSRKQTRRKEIPRSDLEEIQPWMSLGWSQLWKHEQDNSLFRHTPSLQVKATGKLSKTVTVTSGLKRPASPFDNHGLFEML